MIKLNLLPSYIFEKKRILLSLVVFVVLLGATFGVIFKAQMDYTAQEKWFQDDKTKFGAIIAEATAQQPKGDEWKGVAGKYDGYIDFFDPNISAAHNQKIINAFQEVARKVGGTKAYYSDMTITGDSFTMHGKIKGLMSFVGFYFKAKDNGLTVTPAGELKNPYPRPLEYPVIAFTVEGKISEALPTPGNPPEATILPSDFYKGGEPAAGGTTDPNAAAGSTPGMPPGGPGGAPGMPQGGGPGGAPGTSTP